MDFLILSMTSPPGKGGQGGIISFLPMFIIIIFIFYFLIMRPEQKKKKEHQATLDDLKKGDKVVTSSGIIGIVAGLKSDILILKIADNVKIEILRNNISQVLSNNESKAS